MSDVGFILQSELVQTDLQQAKNELQHAMQQREQIHIGVCCPQEMQNCPGQGGLRPEKGQ